MDFQIIQHEWLDSTNDEAKRQAQAGAPAGTVIVAEGQRAGRGQQGRTWESPYGTNIYASLILRPAAAPSALQDLTQQVGELLAEVIRSYLPDQQVQVKLPNDILVENRKICGILCESSVTNGEFDWIVVGFGINVNEKSVNLPENLQNIAVSMIDLLGEPVDRARLLESCLNALQHLNTLHA